MSNLLDSLGQLIVQYPSWKYLILAGGMILQGEITILVSVYLALNQSISWLEFITVGPLALLIAETIIYLTGKILRHTRLGWRIYKKVKPQRRLQFYFFYLKKNLTKLFLISKFLPATNLILFFMTGWAKTKFSQFLKSYFLSLLIWFTGVAAIGYFLVSGLYYLKVGKIFRQAEIGILVILLVIFAIEYAMKKILRKSIAIQEKAEYIGKIIEEEINSPPKNEEKRGTEEM